MNPCLPRWSFQICFIFRDRFPHFDEHIFQMGWFNHQPVYYKAVIFRGIHESHRCPLMKIPNRRFLVVGWWGEKVPLEIPTALGNWKNGVRPCNTCDSWGGVLGKLCHSWLENVRFFDVGHTSLNNLVSISVLVLPESRCIFTGFVGISWKLQFELKPPPLQFLLQKHGKSSR